MAVSLRAVWVGYKANVKPKCPHTCHSQDRTWHTGDRNGHCLCTTTVRYDCSLSTCSFHRRGN